MFITDLDKIPARRRLTLALAGWMRVATWRQNLRSQQLTTPSEVPVASHTSSLSMHMAVVRPCRSSDLNWTAFPGLRKS